MFGFRTNLGDSGSDQIRAAESEVGEMVALELTLRDSRQCFLVD